MSTSDTSDARMAAYEMCREAAELCTADKVEEAAAIYERVITEFGGSTDGYLRELVVSSIYYRASIRLGNLELAARTEPTADLLVRLNQTDDRALRGRLAQAIANETVVLTLLQRQEQALALSKSLVDAVSEDDSHDMRLQAAMAGQNVVEFLNHEGRSEEAKETARIVAARFGQELLAQYDDAIAENRGDRDTRLGVRFRRADLLRAMGRTDEAIDAYADVITKFADDPEVRVVIDRARHSRGVLIAERDERDAPA